MNGEIKTVYGKINMLNSEMNSEINTAYGEIKTDTNCYKNIMR